MLGRHYDVVVCSNELVLAEIYEQDPRKVPTAKKLRTISPAEAAELTYVPEI